MKIFVFAFLLLVAVLAFKEHGKDGDDHGRQLDVDWNDNRFTASSHKDKNTYAVSFVFATNWLPRYVLRYFERQADSVEKFAARWALWKIIEYEEAEGGQPGFEPGVDTRVSVEYLWAGWDNMVVTNTTTNGVVVWTAQSTYDPGFPKKPKNHATMVVSTTISSDTIQTILNGSMTSIGPNSVKWGFYMSNYPYQSNTSRLAMKVSFDCRDVVKTEDGVQTNNNQNLSALVLTASSAVDILAAWTPTVNIQGPGCVTSTVNVATSEIYSGEASGDQDDLGSKDPDNIAWGQAWRIVYFSFLTDPQCRPSVLNWDPEFGVALGKSSLTTPSFALFFLALFVLKLVF